MLSCRAFFRGNSNFSDCDHFPGRFSTSAMATENVRNGRQVADQFVIVTIQQRKGRFETGLWLAGMTNFISPP
jgi:hypothetical protein